MEKSTNCFLLTALYLCMLNVSTATPEVWKTRKLGGLQPTHGFAFDDAEFLSIDCGAASNYTDELGINWVTDDKYIETGTKVELQVGDDFSRELHTFRYFTRSRSRNCYVLPVDTGTTYLLRVRLFPGVDSSDGNPSISLPLDFNVTFNINHWFSYSAIDDSDRNVVTYESVFHSFQRNEVYLCLWRGTNGTPFINSVELRAVPSESYIDSNDGYDPKFMLLGDRINTGTAANDTSIIRYPDDNYDRFWWPAVRSRFPSFTRVEASPKSTYVTRGPAGDDGYNLPPNKILHDAWAGRNLSFRISKERVRPTKIYAVFYVKEIRHTNDTYMKANPLVTVFSSGGSTSDLNLYSVGDSSQDLHFDNDDDFIDFSIVSEESSADALLNGFEYYYLSELDLSATYSLDKTTLNELQKSFNLEDWTGDPCYPVAWDWLTCDPNTSTVSTLYDMSAERMLANMNISGSIPESIGRLLGLTEIHLNDNHLNGPIPQSMLSLSKLQVLALDNNNLMGKIPGTFQNKVNFTFAGNPNLCLPGDSRCDLIPPAPSTVVVPSAAVANSRLKSEVLCLKISFLVSILLLLSV